MDPYVERSHYWRSLHAGLLVHLQARWNPQLLPRYRVDLEVSMTIDRAGDDPVLAVTDAGVREFLPPDGRPTRRRKPQAAVVGVIALPRPVRRPRRWLTIRDTQSRKVVTAVELLSPSDKRPGKDRVRYLNKRARYLTSSAALVEIDLLRAWGRMPADGMPAADYCVLVSRPDERPEVGLWPFGVRDPFPQLAVPLPDRTGEPLLDLRPAFDQAYDGGGYRLDAYRTPPDPPLAAADAAWAAALAPAAG
jgi:hypothetical protein